VSYAIPHRKDRLFLDSFVAYEAHPARGKSVTVRGVFRCECSLAVRHGIELMFKEDGHVIRYYVPQQDIACRRIWHMLGHTIPPIGLEHSEATGCACRDGPLAWLTLA
jgi:hypothetical protein